ncbi:MAG TPA: MFS transporter [Thermomicrobiaceae bacterium]|nr:MFS transporter [Thermomicrobiaceae bacterium]
MTTETRVVRRTRVPLLALFTGNAISLIGSQLTAIAVPWFVLVTTGSAGKTGLTGAAAILPMILAGTLGGSFVDRLGFKRASVLADLAAGLAMGLIPLLYHTVGLAFWQLLALVFLVGLLDAPGGTARQSLIPDLAALGGASLERVNSGFASIGRGAQLVGAPLAGVLIAIFGASNVLWLDAGSFLVSALLIAAAVPGAATAARLEDEASLGYLEGLRQAVGFIRRDSLFASVLIFVAVTNFLGSPLFAVILPVYAERVLGSSVALGIIFGGFGAGALAGALLYGALAHRLPRRPTLLAGFALNALALLALAGTPGTLGSALLMALAGLAAGPLNPILMTAAHERIPEQMRGRIFGLMMAVSWVAMPAGILAGGYLVQLAGAAPVIFAIGLAQLLITAGMVFNPALRRLEPASAP